MSTRLLAGAILALLAGACAPASAPVPVSVSPHDPAAETRRLYAWLDSAFQQELTYLPQIQTQLGIIRDLEAYGRWDDISEAGQLAARQRQRAQHQTFRTRFDPARLDAAGRLSHAFFDYQQRLEERQWAVRESNFVFSPVQDAIAGLTTFLINNHRVGEPAHAEAYLARLRGIGAQIDTLTALAERRAAAGVRLPTWAYPRLLASAEALLAGAPFEPEAADGALLADFRQKVSALELPATQRDALIAQAAAALSEVYQPALRRYTAALGRMAAQAEPETGAWKMPGAAEYYATRVALFTTRDDLTPARIHELGLAEVARIQNEMLAIMRQVAFAGTLQEFFEFLRTDDRFYYPDTPAGRQRYLDESADYVARVMERAPAFFNRLPQAPLEVRAVEPFREATAPLAFYSRPSLDGSRPGYYYVNLRSMRDNPTYLMESLAYHEGAPGHHFQLALAQELTHLPLLHRLIGFSAFIEGWALYAEALGKDMGFFTDPYKDFGRLSYELFRAVRLVVDTGIHDQRWTRAEAIAYMLENTPMTEGDITAEVERYIVWPGQALSYKIGMNTIVELRDLARAELGDRFDWGGFHDAVLTAGPIPLALLEQRVRDWIAHTR
jgi:uncharacterized protein (DUF885 family)